MSGKEERRLFGSPVRVRAGRISGRIARGMAALVLVFALAVPRIWAQETVSGRLVNGFRVVNATELAASPDIVVYRGDYIKFEVKGEEGPVLAVPALDIETVLSSGLDQAPYFKMKQTGVFDYSLGEIRGAIRVVEYQGTHYQVLTAQEAREIIETLNPLILDVRTPGEFKAGRIEGAKLLPVQALAQNLSVLSDYKEEPILIYCATGNRSTVAAKILIDNGFRRIFNLKKGIRGWARQGLPVTK